MPALDPKRPLLYHESRPDKPMTETQSLPGNLPEYSVSEIAQALKRTVEDAFGVVRIRGEISGFKRATSGHVYFALKDADAVIDAVMWRGTAGRLAFKPEDGLEVVAQGKITTYPGRSKYQIVVEAMEPAGAGALMALLEARKKKLAAEGLFDPSRKRALPYLPEVIGVVTSPTGAVLRDILHRLRERFPSRVLVWPVAVQGEKAAGEIAAAIRGFNALAPDGEVPRPDLLIVARGGGSIEDLWAFNEEIVVRAAAESKIPLISAVGHETDTTLIDFASDRRAPTPTAAAEIAVPVRAEILEDVLDKARRLSAAERRSRDEARMRLDGLLRGLRHPGEIVGQKAQRLDDLIERLRRSGREGLRLRGDALRAASGGLRIGALREQTRRLGDALGHIAPRLGAALDRFSADRARQIEAFGRLLESFSYHGVLARGFAVVRDEAGKPVTSAQPLKGGEAISLEFRDGEKRARIEGAKPDAKQGSLF